MFGKEGRHSSSKLFSEGGRKNVLSSSDGGRRVNVGVAKWTLVRLEERSHLDRLVQGPDVDLGAFRGLFARRDNREQVSVTKERKKNERGEGLTFPATALVKSNETRLSPMSCR